MRAQSIASLLLASLASLAVPSVWASACEKLVVTGAAEQPPYLWRGAGKPAKLVGASADIAAEIGKRLGVKIEILDSGTASQALADVQSGRVDLLLGSALDMARLESLDFVHPPMFELPSVVWLRKDAGFEYLGWNDLRGRNGVRLKGVQAGPQFEAFARANLTLSSVDTPRQAFERLQAGKADYLLLERQAGAAAAAGLGLAAEALQAHEPPVFSEQRYLALSHASACNEPRLRGQLAVIMIELAASGLSARLIETNLQRWRAEQTGPAATVQEQTP